MGKMACIRIAFIAMLMLAIISFSVGCNRSDEIPDSGLASDSVQAKLDGELDLLGYLIMTDVDSLQYGLIRGEDGELLTTFDPSASSVSNYIPSYYVSDAGEVEEASVVHAPLYDEGGLAGFFVFDRAADNGLGMLEGITEEGAQQVSDFVKRHGSISIIYDCDGAWMVSGFNAEKLVVDRMKWRVPIGLRGELSFIDEGYPEGLLGSIGCVEDLEVKTTDLIYRHAPNLVSGERMFNAGYGFPTKLS